VASINHRVRVPGRLLRPRDAGKGSDTTVPSGGLGRGCLLAERCRVPAPEPFIHGGHRLPHLGAGPAGVEARGGSRAPAPTAWAQRATSTWSRPNGTAQTGTLRATGTMDSSASRW
jgi:hypothetical protein